MKIVWLNTWELELERIIFKIITINLNKFLLKKIFITIIKVLVIKKDKMYTWGYSEDIKFVSLSVVSI